MESFVLRFRGAILVSMLFAFALTLLPLPETLLTWRPEWVALTLIHWVLMQPKKSSIALAWFAGLLLDALYGSSLGQHALGLSVVVFITMRLRLRINVFTLSHQLTVLLVALGVYMLINLWVLGFTGNTPTAWLYWLSLAGSLIIWPFYHWLLSRLFSTLNRFDD
ncbi:rod shape-determining protein MreD [Leucothrix sargassi]|nr:rod shape-determining protein MreD [Leucothrix sargassi]